MAGRHRGPGSKGLKIRVRGSQQSRGSTRAISGKRGLIRAREMDRADNSWAAFVKRLCQRERQTDHGRCSGKCYFAFEVQKYLVK